MYNLISRFSKQAPLGFYYGLHLRPKWSIIFQDVFAEKIAHHETIVKSPFGSSGSISGLSMHGVVHFDRTMPAAPATLLIHSNEQDKPSGFLFNPFAAKFRFPHEQSSESTISSDTKDKHYLVIDFEKGLFRESRGVLFPLHRVPLYRFLQYVYSVSTGNITLEGEKDLRMKYGAWVEDHSFRLFQNNISDEDLGNTDLTKLFFDFEHTMVDYSVRVQAFYLGDSSLNESQWDYSTEQK